MKTKRSGPRPTETTLAFLDRCEGSLKGQLRDVPEMAQEHPGGSVSSSPGGRSVDPRSPAQRYSVSAEQGSLARQNEALTKRLEELERLVRGAQVHPTKPLPPIHKDRQPLFREMEREAERLNPQGESVQRLVVVNDAAGFGGNPPAALKGDDVLAWAEEYARKARTCHMTDEVAISLMVQYVEPALQEKVRPVIECTVATGSPNLEMVLTEVKNLFGAEVSSRYYKRMLDAVQWIGARSTGDKIRLLSLREAAVRGVAMDEMKAMRRYASKVPEEMRALAFMVKRQTNSLAELVKTLVDAEWDSVEMERLKKTGTASAVPSSVAPKVSEPVDQVSAVGDRCFSCGKEGHFARDCHQQQRKESRQPEPQPQDGRRGFSRERNPGMDSKWRDPRMDSAERYPRGDPKSRELRGDSKGKDPRGYSRDRDERRSRGSSRDRQEGNRGYSGNRPERSNRGYSGDRYDGNRGYSRDRYDGSRGYSRDRYDGSRGYSRDRHESGNRGYPRDRNELGSRNHYGNSRGQSKERYARGGSVGRDERGSRSSPRDHERRSYPSEERRYESHNQGRGNSPHPGKLGRTQEGAPQRGEESHADSPESAHPQKRVAFGRGKQNHAGAKSGLPPRKKPELPRGTAPRSEPQLRARGEDEESDFLSRD